MGRRHCRHVATRRPPALRARRAALLRPPAVAGAPPLLLHAVARVAAHLRTLLHHQDLPRVAARPVRPQGVSPAHAGPRRRRRRALAHLRVRGAAPRLRHGQDHRVLRQGHQGAAPPRPERRHPRDGLRAGAGLPQGAPRHHPPGGHVADRPAEPQPARARRGRRHGRAAAGRGPRRRGGRRRRDQGRRGRDAPLGARPRPGRPVPLLLLAPLVRRPLDPRQHLRQEDPLCQRVPHHALAEAAGGVRLRDRQGGVQPRAAQEAVRRRGAAELRGDDPRHRRLEARHAGHPQALRRRLLQAAHRDHRLAPLLAAARRRAVRGAAAD
mmetsp:Transcript_68044/g.186478  ORF Transcript_68044/g.186478 Transcript_68044/m.186478 type:complete len:325 (+) Transcript_68044:210-1184(+)